MKDSRKESGVNRRYVLPYAECKKGNHLNLIFMRARVIKFLYIYIYTIEIITVYSLKKSRSVWVVWRG